ncbi:unnamed protein product [Boreogadus saida]
MMVHRANVLRQKLTCCGRGGVGGITQRGAAGVGGESQGCGAKGPGKEADGVRLGSVDDEGGSEAKGPVKEVDGVRLGSVDGTRRVPLRRGVRRRRGGSVRSVSVRVLWRMAMLMGRRRMAVQVGAGQVAHGGGGEG